MLVFFNYSFVETYNALMTIAVVSSETDNMSRTEIAFGILRDMKAAGLGKAIGVLKRFVPLLSNNILYCWVCLLPCYYVYQDDGSSSVDLKNPHAFSTNFASARRNFDLH